MREMQGGGASSALAELDEERQLILPDGLKSQIVVSCQIRMDVESPNRRTGLTNSRNTQLDRL